MQTGLALRTFLGTEHVRNVGYDPAKATAKALVLDQDTACVVAQYPNFFGGLDDLQGLAQQAHDAGALFVVAAEEHLRGKPQPDTFLAGARRLGVEPAQAVVFEDAISGVAAGRAGNFGYVVGVDRVGQADALKKHGADVVVQDLAELMEDGK